jgi:hypothetical protein
VIQLANGQSHRRAVDLNFVGSKSVTWRPTRGAVAMATDSSAFHHPLKFNFNFQKYLLKVFNEKLVVSANMNIPLFAGIIRSNIH